MLGVHGRPAAPTMPARDYLVYVVAESADEIALLRFGPEGGRVDHRLTTGIMPADVDGPHGLAVSPDGRYYYVSIAHGTPFGTVWKYTTHGDTLKGRVELGNFPATLQLTPDGAFAYVVNFNLHGDPVPSSVSVVATEPMVEVARTTTCVMPHGSRVNPQGTKQYSACMMDDLIVEIDTRTFGAARHFMVTKGKEHGDAGPPHLAERGEAVAIGTFEQEDRAAERRPLVDRPERPRRGDALRIHGDLAIARLELVHGAGEHDATAVDEHEIGEDVLDLFHLMCRHHDGAAAIEVIVQQ